MTRASLIAAAAALVVLGAAVLFLLSPGGKKESEVLVLCGGSMRRAMERVIENYAELGGEGLSAVPPACLPVRQQTGRGRDADRGTAQAGVIMTVGDSGDLCAQLRLTQKGDIYVCHDPFMPWAAENGLVQDWRTVGYLKPVIAVPEGNPQGIGSLEDLARPGLRIAIGDTKYSTSGVIANEILKRAEFGEDVRRNVKVMTKGHQKRATDVTLGLLDATIIWNAVAFLFRDGLDVIPIEDTYVDAVTSATFGRCDLREIKVTIGLTAHARGRENARRFFEYATTEGRAVFAEMGFTPAVRQAHDGRVLSPSKGTPADGRQ